MEYEPPAITVFDDIPMSARHALHYWWGRTLTSLTENPTNPHWYIDDRANPKEFWKLLAIGYPELYKQRKGKTTIPKTYLPFVVGWVRRHRDVLEQVMNNPNVVVNLIESESTC